MIRNNLAILMSERGMKNSVLASRTGISKNTISSTAQNDGKMIQLETINKLCQVLGVTPSDFFLYTPYDVDIEVSVNELKTKISLNSVYQLNSFLVTSVDIDLILTVKKGGNTLDTYVFEIPNYKETNLFIDSFLDLDFKYSGDDINQLTDFWSQIPTPFVGDLKKEICKEIDDKVREHFNKEELPYDIDLAPLLKSLVVMITITDLEIPF